MGFINGEVDVKIGESTSKEFSIINKNIKPSLKNVLFTPMNSDDHSPEDFVAEEIRVYHYFVKDGELRCILTAPNGSSGTYKLKYYIEWQ